MVILAVIALIVIPPEKLPEVARQLARFLNDLKRNTSGIWDDIKQDAAFKPEDILKPQNKSDQGSAIKQEMSEEKKNESN